MDETNTMDNQNYAGLQQDRNADAQDEPIASSGATAVRMSAITATLLILMALGIDGLQVFLNFIVIGVVLNWIIDIFTWLLFFVWLKSLGISGSIKKDKDLKRLIFLASAFGFELLPILNSFPGWTAFALGTVIIEYGGEILEKVPIAKKFIKKKES
ncbi:hypothetical protein A3B05_00535 [Candidatus Giovannonibacteria bacterium RIFCSPLOWO2_01_FULL_43_160]|uniref:Uncharacterized protein n=2 Tax=Candidatus Giovannoniibacteriota TaxID=1752738 RepID=A0A1F5XY21_9BACT|nr:MAG: hypothetical protein A2652_00985 [Candidatus Giovannonibacteria bacterium RIFCSPHIGHO2_01_FULL_43_140]OGF70218.1 MAG: hypothetical protein A3C76_01010 [Candidatus Giovannonibacteria bacterium RIFCSPHIGHO2_02_FULL_44_51]OGF72482.1 MAG: hypothetical protein A3E35_02845 [Candidatus Giovannonibacteria bacterium RIFCSPHIGHO2_12_FULL_44_22]OGF75204.1 MAG: hypothetical protein A3B05_00535 [Candidatus Giovannonibacteria bacterium RIFCSPLOWO2_01_FULL_43_160]OGF86358.1 MAG: hypothetical protein A